MRTSYIGAMLLTAVLVAVPVGTAGFLTAPAAPAVETKTFFLGLEPAENLMVSLDHTGEIALREVATDANNQCLHNSVTPGNAISPLENDCTLTDTNSQGWLVGWQLPPNIAAVPGTFIGDTNVDFSGSNGASLTFRCTWEWIPRLGQTVSCRIVSITGLPFGNLNADFNNYASGTDEIGAVGSWHAILNSFP